jgi:hypothetical protein
LIRKGLTCTCGGYVQGARKLEGREQRGKVPDSWLRKAKSAVGGAFSSRGAVRYSACPFLPAPNIGALARPGVVHLRSRFLV